MKCAVGNPEDESSIQTVQIMYSLKSSSEKFPVYLNTVLDRARSFYFQSQDFDESVST